MSSEYQFIAAVFVTFSLVPNCHHSAANLCRCVFVSMLTHRLICCLFAPELCYPSCSRPVSIQSVWPVKPQRLLPWSVVPVEQPSTDSPSMATGRRKYIPKTTQVSSNCWHALMHTCTLCRSTCRSAYTNKHKSSFLNWYKNCMLWFKRGLSTGLFLGQTQ